MFPELLRKISRISTLLIKKFKRAFKDKEPGNPFLRTVKILSETTHSHSEFRMILDTGCDLNMISVKTLQDLLMFNHIRLHEEVLDLCTCLNGGQLSSIGTITLRWKGKRFRRIYTTEFQVIDGDWCPFEVILGAETLHEHGIVKFAGFGGRRFVVLPSISKDQKDKTSKKKEGHKKEVAANDIKREADIRAKKEARRDRSGTAVN